MKKKKLQRQRKSVSHSSWSCLHASSLSYTDKCSRHSAQDEPPPQKEASLTCGRQFSYLFQNWNQVQPVLGWKMLEDTTVPTGYEGHRLKELARCSVVVCFSPGNCVLRYDRPRRRHKQAINANTRSWFNERDGVEALGNLMKRLNSLMVATQGRRSFFKDEESHLLRLSRFSPTMDDKQCQALHIALRPECFEEKTRQCIPAQLQSIMFIISWRKLLGCVFLLCLLLVHLLWEWVWKVTQQWSRDSS